MRLRWICPALFLLLLATGLKAQQAAQRAAAPGSADPLPSADPARPTVTVPAQIPPVAYLQFEQGFNQAAGSPGLDGQFSIPQVTKLSFTSHLELQFVSEPFAFTALAPGQSSRAPGDLILGGQYLLNPAATGYTPNVAIAYNHRLYTGAAANLDFADFSNSAVLLFQGKLPAGFTYITNSLFNEQTGSTPARRAQYSQTLTLSHQLSRPLAFTAELWHFTQPFLFADRGAAPIAHANAVGLLGTFGYRSRPNLVIDFGAEHGLTSTSTLWQGFAGFTYVLPRRVRPRRTA